MHTHTDIVAVIVTHNPDPSALQMLCERLVSQVGGVVIVDNHSDLSLQPFSKQWENIELIESEINHGIAWAQNIGINYATLNNAKYVVLFDQDSIPEKDMAPLLLKEYLKLTDGGCCVAAVGPNYQNINSSNVNPFVTLTGYRLTRLVQAESPVKALFLISSGCLMPLSVVKDVGLMQEDLFIDYVDVEWCLRAKSKGYDCYGSVGANMVHSIGKQTKRFIGRDFSLHDSTRYYYLFRNAILLYKKDYIQRQFKIADGINLISKFVVYLIVHPSRLECLKMFVVGIWHGIVNKTGRL